MSLDKEVKSQVTKFTTDLGVIVGFIGICIAAVSNMNDILSSKKLLYAVISGVFIILMRVCYKIWRSDKNNETYSIQQQKTAGWVMLIIGIAAPLSIASMVLFDKQELKMSIIVTPFSREPEAFSASLFNFIEANKKIHKFDSIQTNFHDSCLVRNSQNTEKIISTIFSKLNSNRGILVFGYRNNDLTKEKHFNCYIYINNLRRLHVDSAVINTEQSNEKVIYMLNPLFIEFASSTQAEIISDFIMGLLFINSEKYELAEETFNKIKTGDGDKLGRVSDQLRANCDYWIGETFLKEKQAEKAFKSFEDAYERDSNNKFILQKLATLELSFKGDSIRAYDLFLNVKKVDTSIIIPMTKPIGYDSIVKKRREAMLLKKDSISLVLSLNSVAHNSKHFNPVSQNSKYVTINQKESQNILDTLKASKLITPTSSLLASSKTSSQTSGNTNTINASNSNPRHGYLQLPIHENEFSQTDIPYQMILFNSRSNLFYITNNNDLILFTDDTGKFYKIIGKFIRSGINSWIIQDLNKTTMYSVLNKKILSSNVEVGELREVRN